MGLVYQRARLVIAASHANDVTEGCFLQRPTLPPSVELPYVSSTGEVAGSMYVQQKGNPDHCHPDRGPLNKRAWATQEWLLARRTIYYTRSRLVWMCKETDVDETGRKARTAAEARSWDDIMLEYSRRLLTRRTDKLMALQGLATETQKSRPTEDYLFGIWTADLPRHLLWHGRGPSTRAPESLHIPSWA